MKAITVYSVVATALILSSCRPEAPQQNRAESPYPQLAQDAAALRDTMPLPSPQNRTLASSTDACMAARRIFTKYEFVGKSRAHVLDLLGDPQSISSYGVSAQPQPDAPLVYRFDSGFGGWEYTLNFTNGVVARFETQSLD